MDIKMKKSVRPLKPYFEDLKLKFYTGFVEIQNSDEQKIFMVGCKDAGNYDYLFIVGSEYHKGHFQFIHIDYSRMITFDNKELVNEWFENMDDGFYEQYEDLFEYQWITKEDLMEHVTNYIEHHI